ncbi:hypothetical protein EJB05_24518, partial [Eragrostis curvula]
GIHGQPLIVRLTIRVSIPTGVCYPPTTDLETRCIDDEQQQQLRSDILELLRAPKQPLQQMHRP